MLWLRLSMSLFVFCLSVILVLVFVFCCHTTAYGLRISDWSSDVCSSALLLTSAFGPAQFGIGAGYVRTDGISNAAVGTERDGYRQVSVNLTNRTEIGDTVELRAFGLFADSRVELDRKSTRLNSSH